jgi:hypothetical protein
VSRTHRALDAFLIVLVLHVLVILFTGGWTARVAGITVTARHVTPPILVLLGVLLVRRLRSRAGADASQGRAGGHAGRADPGGNAGQVGAGADAGRAGPDGEEGRVGSGGDVGGAGSGGDAGRAGSGADARWGGPRAEAVLLAAALLLVYLANGRTIWSGDTLPARYLPLSLLREGDFDLDEFRFLYADGDPYYLRVVDGRRVSAYPVGAALLALPFYVPSALGGVAPQAPVIEELEKLAAATLVALSAALLYLTAREWGGRGPALWVTLAYALGGSSLSASSQALWQHAPSQLALAAGLYCVVRGRPAPSWVGWAGLPLAFAVIARPTNLVLVAPVAVWALARHPGQALAFGAAALPPVLFQLAYNSWYFGNPLRTQVPLLSGLHWETPLGEGLAGLLLSPGRGLFVYSPVFALALVGLARAWRPAGDGFLRALGLGVGLTVLLYGRWNPWWGGWSYGPRLLADLTPALALGLLPLAAALGRSRLLRGLLVLTLAWSIAAHAIGAFWDDFHWNEVKNVDRAPESLWVWHDNQLVNPVREILARGAVLAEGQPTSRGAPELLAARYEPHGPPPRTSSPGGWVRLTLRATNVGQAVWLAWPERAHGVVTLGWRWGRAGEEVRRVTRGAPLRTDVHPGQSRDLRLWIPAPAEPGRYVLTIELAARGLGWFSGRGSPPLVLTVDVPARAAGPPGG